MKNKKIKLSVLISILSVSFAVLVVGVILIIQGAGSFFATVTGNTEDYNTISKYELKKGLFMEGKIYYIYDRVVTEYSEKGNNSKEPKAYYYAVPFDGEDKYVMIVKTDTFSETSVELEKLYNAPEDTAYEYLFDIGVPVEGKIEKSNKDVETAFETWKIKKAGDVKEKNSVDISDFKMVPYIYDCTSPIASKAGRFIAGIIMMLLAIAVAVVFLIKYLKEVKAEKLQQQADAPLPNMPGQQAVGTSQQLFATQNGVGVSQQLYTTTTGFDSSQQFYTQNGIGTSQQIYPTQNGVGTSQQIYPTQNGIGTSQQMYNSQPNVGMPQQMYNQQVNGAVPQQMYNQQVNGTVPQQMYNQQVNGAIPQQMFNQQANGTMPQQMFNTQANIGMPQQMFNANQPDDDDDDDEQTVMLGYENTGSDDDDDQTVMLGYENTDNDGKTAILGFDDNAPTPGANNGNIQYRQVVTGNSVRYEPIMPNNNNLNN